MGADGVKEILSILETLEDKQGGYYRTDLVQFSEARGKSRWYTWRLLKTLRTDPRFQRFHYLGCRPGAISPNERKYIEEVLSRNCLFSKNFLFSDLNARRQSSNLPPIQRQSFYYHVKRLLNQSGLDENDPYRWLRQRRITTTPSYSLQRSRKSLNTLFTFTDLSNRNIEDIHTAIKKLKECEQWLSNNYSVVKFCEYVNDLRLRKRKDAIRHQLSSLHGNELPEVQVRLIFELQVSTIIDLYDYICSQIIFHHGRMTSSFAKERVVIERDLWMERSNHGVKNASEEPVSSKAKLMRFKKYKVAYGKLFEMLIDFTGGFASPIIEPLGKKALRLMEQLRKERRGEKEISLHGLYTDTQLIRAAMRNKSLMKALLTRKFIIYLQQGRICISRSFYYLNVGKLIEQIACPGEEEMLTEEDLALLWEGDYPIDPLWFEKVESEVEEELKDDQLPLIPMVDYSDVADTVDRLVLMANPDWYSKHVELFREMTDNMFDFTMDEKKFRSKLTEAIGFFGRNFRYRDDDSFMRSKYLDNVTFLNKLFISFSSIA